MTTKDILEMLESYVPLFQALLWPLLVFIVIIMLRKNLLAFLDATEQRIREGSSIKIGSVELGQQEIVTKTSDLNELVEVFGNPDNFQLLFKVKAATWIKSTKAMEVPGGCVVQVTTERKNSDGSWTNSEALTFVPGVVIIDDQGTGRHLGISNPSSKEEGL